MKIFKIILIICRGIEIDKFDLLNIEKKLANDGWYN